MGRDTSRFIADSSCEIECLLPLKKGTKQRKKKKRKEKQKMKNKKRRRNEKKRWKKCTPIKIRKIKTES